MIGQRARAMGLGLVIVLPLLAGCEKGDPGPKQSGLSDAQQQQIQQQMDQQRAAADAQRAAASAQSAAMAASQGFRH